MADDGTFSGKKAALIHAYSLPPYPTVRDAAKLAQVGERTAYRWWNEDPDVRKACLDARQRVQDEITASATDQYIAMLPDALDAEKHLVRNARREDVRLAAAIEITDRALGKVPATSKSEQRFVDKNGEDLATLLDRPIIIHVIEGQPSPFDQCPT